MQDKQYVNMEKIYASPYSKIFCGRECDTGQLVVLKTGGQDTMTPEANERLRREYRMLRMVDNPHVVRALGEITLDGRYYLKEQCCPGIVLRQLIKRGGMEWADFYLIAGQMIEGLSALHEAGIIHKDVNPSNVIYDSESGRVVLLDLGISSVFSYEKTEGLKPDNIEGTIRHLAPEQTGRINTALDYRTDFYSLGITFYEMVTGHCPFEAETPTEMVFSHIAKIPPDILAQRPDTPPMLAKIINKLLSKMAKDRYFSCEGLLYDIKRSISEKKFVLGERDFSRRFEFSQHLYGRESEIAQLNSDLKEVMGGAKILVSISGYSGIGKTSLVNEIQEEVLLAGGLYLYGKFDQYHRNVPYYGFFQAIKQFCDLVFLEPEEEIRRWREGLTAILGGDMGLLTSKVTELSLLTGSQPADMDFTPLEERVRFKAVLGKLLSFLAVSEHPLIIFLDDVHLADMGSMEILEEVIRNEGMGYLMLVVCYRDNEVNEAHPLIHSLNKMIRRKGRVTQLDLKGLNMVCAAQMIGDILKTSHEEVSSLTEIIYRKTKGNPFYIKQFLRLCNLKGYITLDVESGNFRWDTEKIQNCPAQENVVDFLLSNLEQIPKETLPLLSTGACIGQNFAVNDVSFLCCLPEGEVVKRLVVAVDLEILVPIEKNSDTGRRSRFQFSHDRFQEAFYKVMPQKERAGIHYQLGIRYEQKASAEDDMEERLFEIADHYAKGLGEAPDEVEKLHIQKILLRAAKRCGLVSAFDTASRYLELLLSQPEIQDDKNRSFLIQVYKEYHAVLCNMVNVKECDRIYGVLCGMVKNPEELADNCCLHITSLSTRGRYQDAFMLGIGLLDQLGVPFTGEDMEQILKHEMELFYQELEALGEDHILRKEEAEDPREFVISKLLNRLCAPGLFFNPLYSFWTILIAARRIFRYGYTPYGLQLYSNLMVPLGALCGDYRTSYMAGKTAMYLAEKHQYREVIYSIYHLFALHTCHWFENIANVIPYARESIKGNALMGEFEYACYGYFTAMTALMETSVHVDELWSEVGPAISFAEKTGNYHSLGTFYSFRQFCRSVRGELGQEGSFDGEGFSEPEHAKQFADNHMAMCYFYVLRALTAVIYRDYGTAYKICCYSAPLMPYITGFYPVALHNFLYSLSICKVLSSGEYCEGPQKRLELAEILNGNQMWLENRKNDAFGNFGHFYLTIQAERKAAEGLLAEALPLYEDALKNVKKHAGNLHHAIISDLIALRYEELGIRTVAEYYLRRTYHLYARWGAEGKCDLMKRQYPELIRQPEYDESEQYNHSESTLYTTTALDMKSVLKASMAISEELQLDGILEKLIYVLLECAGAQNIYYLNKTDGQYEIEAEGHTGLKDTCILSKRVADTGDIPFSIVTFVERTSETVILDDAAASRIYGKDSHIKENNCKSVLCMPIIGKGELKGILYLENNLAAGVFDQHRKDNLIPIAAQLAISLENAYLYEHLRFLVEERTKALKEEIQMRKETEAKLAQMANHDPLTGLPNRRLFHEILSGTLLNAGRNKIMVAVLFVDLDGFKEINDTYGHETGDIVLTAVAGRLRSSVRKGDTVSRMGGDEFVLILDGIEREEEIKQVCNRILCETREPLQTSLGISLKITVSIGVSIYPKDGLEVEELVTSADNAMYRIKRSHKNYYSFV